MNEIEIRSLCPMIAMICAGKTSLLKIFYDIDFLEATAGIGTKFVNIIRYNPKVGKNPKFYHLLVKKVGKEDYKFYKDPNYKEIIGKENIKEENKKLNAKFKKEGFKYEDLFYMVEVGETNLIKDLEYLKNYDLVDIPGVNEYNPDADPSNKSDAPAPIKQEIPDYLETMEDEIEKYAPSSEKTYLTEIFKIIKNKMNNGIIVFSVDNYQHTENYRIIAKLQKVINKPIENFLILLNKIDKSENKKYDLDTLNGKIVKYFPSAKIFNPTKNLLLPCSTIQLENESKMDKSFEHLMHYHFLNFLMSSKNTPDGNETTSGFTFIDFLKKINSNKSLKKKDFIEKINKILDDEENSVNILGEISKIIQSIKDKHKDDNFNLGVRPDDFNKDEISKIKENLQTEEGEEEQEETETEKEEFNLDYIEGNAIILYYYSEFKNKKGIPPCSMDTQNIMNYFTMKNMKQYLEEKEKERKMEEDDKKLLEREKNLNKKIDNLSRRMDELKNEKEVTKISMHKLNLLRQYINSSIGILKTAKNLYIPLLGVSNAGKSTILNGIIGYRILPAQKNECTKKGIIIKHWNKDYAVLRTTKYKFEKIGNDKIYYFEPGEEIIAKGIKNIHRMLEGANGEFPKKEENFFYEIDINIKFVNDLKLDESLKEKICFIDLPGFGTNNEFERQGIYANLMKSCNLFLFVVFNLKIRESDNKKMLDNLYNQMCDYRGIPKQAFIKKCLFIVNFDKDQDTSEISMMQAKNDIISVVDGLDKRNINDLNICFFNAKYYENYIFKLSYYNSAKNLILYEYNEYTKLQEQKWRGLIEKIRGGTFNKYLKEQLKDNIANDIQKKFNEKEININEDIEKEVKETLGGLNLKFTTKEITLITKYITFGKDNIVFSDLLFDSNIDVFAKELLININKAKLKEDEEINNNLKLCFKILDDVFEVDPNVKFGPCQDAPIAKIVKPHVQQDLDKMVNEIEKLLNSINKEFSDNDIVKILMSCSQKLSSSLATQKSNICKMLESKKWDAVQKDIEDTFKKEMNSLKDDLMKALNSSSENIKKYLDKCYDNLDNFYSKKIERKNLLYKNHISNCLGGSNNIEQTIDQMISDIISSSRVCTDKDKCDGIFSWLGAKIFNDNYLHKVIDDIIKNSAPKIKTFCDTVQRGADYFKKSIIDEISSSKNRVVDELKEKKIQEDIEINLANSKNEEEKKKWEEEKRKYEEKKRNWELLCKKYRTLRDEITGLRLTKEFATAGNKI